MTSPLPQNQGCTWPPHSAIGLPQTWALRRPLLRSPGSPDINPDSNPREPWEPPGGATARDPRRSGPFQYHRTTASGRTAQKGRELNLEG